MPDYPINNARSAHNQHLSGIGTARARSHQFLKSSEASQAPLHQHFERIFSVDLKECGRLFGIGDLKTKNQQFKQWVMGEMQ